MTTVSFSGADAGDFRQGALNWAALNALRPAKSNPPDTVDLSALRLVRPYSLVAIAALGCLSQGKAALILPAWNDCRRYVLRSGLSSFFTPLASEPVEDSERVIPVRQLFKPSQNFADDIVRKWEQQLGSLPPQLGPRLADHIDEIVRNALSHAESEIGCLVAANVFPETRRLEVAVLDLGQTIRGHLQKHPKHSRIASDEEAIKLATVEGVTGTLPGTLNSLGEPNSGVGLFELKTYCQSNGGGDLTILSGSSMVTYSPTEEPISRHFAGRFPGCLVNIQFLIW